MNFLLVTICSASLLALAGCGGFGSALMDSASNLSSESNERYGNNRMNNVGSQVPGGNVGFRQVNSCSDCNSGETCKTEHKDDEEQVMCYAK